MPHAFAEKKRATPYACLPARACIRTKRTDTPRAKPARIPPRIRNRHRAAKRGVKGLPVRICALQCRRTAARRACPSPCACSASTGLSCSFCRCPRPVRPFSRRDVYKRQAHADRAKCLCPVSAAPRHHTCPRLNAVSKKTDPQACADAHRFRICPAVSMYAAPSAQR